MKVVFCSAEVAPFSQAGGLGDVLGSLPRAIAEQDTQAVIITPLYGLVDAEAHQLQKTDISFEVQFHGKAYPITIWKGLLPRSEVVIYFVDNYDLFGSRKQVYPYGQPEWELEGFLVLSQAVFELLRRVNYRPDILHVHDWHTASVATTLADIRPYDQYFSRTQSVLTIHNLNYQGEFGEINWLKEGILKADAVTTVSPTYAQEIQTPEFGAKLDPVIREYAHKVSGILNGIDTELYNPEADAFITTKYNRSNFAEGKKQCKEALQVEMGLPVVPGAPLIGFIGRLAEQKGLDILLQAMKEMDEQASKPQWVLLGTGDPKMEEALKGLNTKSQNIRTFIGFNTALAQKIYAGCDMFMMPSAFEPCGLGQLISLRYGTVPIVRGVGGLVDTITDVRNQPHRGNGFKFAEYSAAKLKETVQAAIDYYHNNAVWPELVGRGMDEDHSWKPSAEAYKTLYAHLTHPAPISA
ncbi:glycogen synthase [Vampirovibrio sp.]|uniref:glycogen synthase n=1 Tax=Vampirovibrio sp. TaxID=2717857 RepID=UPI00359457B5